MNPQHAAPSLIDAAGTAHAPAGADARIACFVPSITELVVALGLALLLVARTNIHPAAALNDVPAVGGTKKVHLEKLRALAPTHAILNVEENTRAMDAALREFVPHVIVTHPRRPEDNPPLYRLLGGIFGKEEEAEALAARFDAAHRRLAALRPALPARRVLYFIWKQPWMGVSRGTYIANMLALANWEVLAIATASTIRSWRRRSSFSPRPIPLFATEPYPFAEAVRRVRGGASTSRAKPG
ncbi:MAG: helical backbone metal receptor [Alphaproteobacteria bacterium]